MAIAALIAFPGTFEFGLISGALIIRTAIARPTPRRRSSSTRAGPRFNCFQAMARKRRLIHASSSCNTDGVWQKPK
jgi:hypothetical protein